MKEPFNFLRKRVAHPPLTYWPFYDKGKQNNRFKRFPFLPERGTEERGREMQLLLFMKNEWRREWNIYIRLGCVPLEWAGFYDPKSNGSLACEYSRFSLLLAARHVSPEGTYATQRQTRLYSQANGSRSMKETSKSQLDKYLSVPFFQVILEHKCWYAWSQINVPLVLGLVSSPYANWNVY